MSRAVLLDALGTLVGLEPPWPAFTQLMRERHGIELEPHDAARALRAEMAYYRTNCQRAGDLPALAGLRAECAGVVAEQLGGPALALDRAALTDTLLAALRFAPYTEVPAALRALRAGGARLVVVSNWDVSLHEVLGRTGLRPLLDGVLTSAEFGATKPAPEIFAAALALAETPAAAAIHVGDSLAEDVAGAQAAGIEPVLLVREPGALVAPGAHAPVGATGVRRIASLAELVGAVA
jgi:putative hydrolase of the HAD superfamily